MHGLVCTAQERQTERGGKKEACLARQALLLVLRTTGVRRQADGGRRWRAGPRPPARTSTLAFTCARRERTSKRNEHHFKREKA